jgi:hypothetical protein
MAGPGLVGGEREGGEGHPLAGGEHPAAVAPGIQQTRHVADRLDPVLDFDEEPRLVAPYGRGRAAQHGSLMSVHVDLYERYVFKAESVHRHQRNRDGSTVDVPAAQRRDAPGGALRGRQPDFRRSAVVGRGGGDDVDPGRKGPGEHFVQRRRLDDDDAPGPFDQSPGPRPVPASDVDHRAAATADLVKAADLRFEPPVGEAGQPDQQPFRYPGGRP